METIKRYASKEKAQADYYSFQQAQLQSFPSEIISKLFNLFKKCFAINIPIGPKQIEDVRKLCNSLLINTPLQIEDEKWLCDNIDKSDMILNRILRYPVKSNIISKWAEENYTNNLFRVRRAELTSWMIDENQNFEIDKQTLIDDFEYCNNIDITAIKYYDDEIAANKIIERDLKDILPSKKMPTLHFDNFDTSSELITSAPELKLLRRFYGVPINSSLHYPVSIPDFDRLRDNFYFEIETTRRITMLWSIGYSRIDINEKAELLKRYYMDETYWTFFKICKKYRLSDLLKWLKDRQK
ncbi:MAG: hypothetical protein M3O67_02460 [Bacteroidota bacterium]|nr:hypothetical protein [Bacteroidota bacterium]